jgi:transcriptional regulator with XRE-family HTH domain
MDNETDKVRPSDSVQAFFAWVFRLLREDANLTQRELARLSCFSASLLTQIETMQRMPSVELAERCDEIMNGRGLLTNLWPLVCQGTYDECYKSFAELEARARKRHTYETYVVPGLFQTEDYMRVLFTEDCAGLRPQAAVEARVESRLARQGLLTLERPAPQWAIIDEAVVRRPIGGRAVMRRQIERIIDIAQLPHVNIQMLPLKCACASGTDGSLSIFSYAKGRRLAYAYALEFMRIMSDEAIVEHYALKYEKLQAQALPLAASLDLLSSILKET